MRVCKSLQRSATLSLYSHLQLSSGRKARRCFTMLVYKPTYTALIRTLSFTSATAREDLLVLPNLARVLSQASNLHSLVIIIPQPSIPFFMRQLTVYGIIRKPPSKILDIRNQQNPTGHDVRSTLHSLRSLCLGENFDLLPIARYRQLTRMVLHQCLEYEELNDVFHALAPDGSNPRLQAFGVNIRHHMPVGEIVKVIGETFPKLRWFAITQRMCDWKVCHLLEQPQINTENSFARSSSTPCRPTHPFSPTSALSP